jgi:hypothetical protein
MVDVGVGTAVGDRGVGVGDKEMAVDGVPVGGGSCKDGVCGICVASTGTRATYKPVPKPAT